MPHLRIDRFTCDRCDSSVDIEVGHGGRTQPEGWARVTLTRPPLASPGEVKSVDMLLCERCARFVQQALYPVPPDDGDEPLYDPDAPPDDGVQYFFGEDDGPVLQDGDTLRIHREVVDGTPDRITYSLHTADPSQPVLESDAGGYPRQATSWSPASGTTPQDAS